MIADNTARQCSVIVRPYGLASSFIQLDDLSAEQIARVAPVSFMQLETSPGNFQAWLAVQGEDDRQFQKRVRRGAGADVGATGATRIAGSVNFKPKYAPDLPVVRITAEQPGLTTTPAELESLGLVAAEEIAHQPFSPPVFPRAERAKKWPSYAICLDRAPLSQDKSGPDRSKADLSFCMIAITWGFGVEETAHQLMQQEESKAAQRTERYALDTARRAALFVKQRKGQHPHA